LAASSGVKIVHGAEDPPEPGMPASSHSQDLSASAWGLALEAHSAAARAARASQNWGYPASGSGPVLYCRDVRGWCGEHTLPHSWRIDARRNSSDLIGA